MNSLLATILIISLALVVPAWCAQQPTAKQLTVNELAATPGSYVGKVTVIGRVAAVTPGKGFTLIDSAKCSTCATDCLTDKNTKKIPFLWGGAAPEVKGVVIVQGTLTKITKGYTFTADKVAKQ